MSTTTYARLQSFFQLVQTVGSFAFGNFLDRYGVRAGLVVNFIACTMAYSLLANGTSVPMLFVSKIPGAAWVGKLRVDTYPDQYAER